MTEGIWAWHCSVRCRRFGGGLASAAVEGQPSGIWLVAWTGLLGWRPHWAGAAVLATQSAVAVLRRTLVPALAAGRTARE